MNVTITRRNKPRGGVPVGMGFENTGGGDVGGSFTDLSPYLSMWPIDTTPGATADDPTSLFPAPGYNIINTETAADMTPAELAAEQDAARKELAKIGNEGATAAQLATGVALGVLRIATAGEKASCTSGYVYQNGDCIHSAPGVAPAGQWFAGISNMAVMGIAGGSLFAVLLLSMAGGGGGGRRR